MAPSPASPIGYAGLHTPINWQNEPDLKPQRHYGVTIAQLLWFLFDQIGYFSPLYYNCFRTTIGGW